MAQDFSDIYEAIRVADKEGRTEDVSKLSSYLESAKPQEFPEIKTFDPRELASPVLPAAVGASAGAIARPMVESGIKAVQQGRTQAAGPLSRGPVVGELPEGHTPFNPRGRSVESSLENWRNYNEAQLEAAKKVRQESALHKKYPGFTRAGAEPAIKALPENATAAQRIAAKIMPGGLSDIANFARGVYDYKLPFIGGVGSLLGRGLVGAGAGMQATDAYNRGVVQGDIPGAVISGVGALGTASTLLPHPAAKVIGTGVGLSAEAINAYRDAMARGQIEHGAPEDYSRVDAMGNAYAQGGLVYLAAGGQPPTLEEIQRQLREWAQKNQPAQPRTYTERLIDMGRDPSIPGSPIVKNTPPSKGASGGAGFTPGTMNPFNPDSPLNR